MVAAGFLLYIIFIFKDFRDVMDYDISVCHMMSHTYKLKPNHAVISLVLGEFIFLFRGVRFKKYDKFHTVCVLENGRGKSNMFSSGKFSKPHLIVCQFIIFLNFRFEGWCLCQAWYGRIIY